MLLTSMRRQNINGIAARQSQLSQFLMRQLAIMPDQSWKTLNGISEKLDRVLVVGEQRVTRFAFHGAPFPNRSQGQAHKERAFPTRSACS
jgi:hypothetical protein